MNRTTSIGLEIEVNQFTHRMQDELDRSLWQTANEHCGIELRSVPCRGPLQIRRLMDSIKQMEKWSRQCGFDNAGTHIHIDFLRDLDPKSVNLGALKRKNAERMASGSFDNPTGTGKKYYWVTPDGSQFARPSDYAAYLGQSFERPADAFRSRKVTSALVAVKRFLSLGVRFADPIIALQHPDRRFNKYCHSVADWDEKLLNDARSVSEIANHKNLAQKHRRHMINVMAFEKYGTIEIRVIKASLSPEKLWPQIFLFTRMAALAKSDVVLPKATGKVTVDVQTLMDACDIHGKVRRSLLDAFRESMDTPHFSIRCYGCDAYAHQGNYIDIGLSRGLCFNCAHDDYFCVHCKSHRPRWEDGLKNRKLDNMIEKGRYLCQPCYNNHLADILVAEKRHGIIYSHGDKVGSGFDANGFRALRRVRALFTR
jgi:hypothetical protein